ncbi:MAG: GDSL-type esterase/lipase family protein [Clostridia bacterium]|nr:GDSL-type esterase/lipase family protein [Clostridia bacterium]
MGLKIGKVTGQYNRWRYTEDLSYAGYSTVNLTKTPANTVTIYDGITPITLGQISSTNYYGSVTTNLSGLGLQPFVIGKKYFVSGYVKNDADVERWFWPRYVGAGANAHGSCYMSITPRRYWTLLTATATNLPQPYWFFNGNGAINNATVTAYIGGFQIELVPDDTKIGVSVMGDSTVAGSSGKKDAENSVEWTRWAEGWLNVPFYNRGVGGNTTQQMIDRWAADMTPLAGDPYYVKYTIIQGGINDLPTQTAEQIVTNLTTMRDLAIADGTIPVMCTISPCNKTGDEETVRNQANALIRSNFNLVIDLDLILKDPANPNQLHPDWVGDGTHFTALGKKAIGQYIANSGIMSFLQPSPYQKLATSPFSQYTDVSYKLSLSNSITL